MDEARLRESLRHLPEARPSEDFTAEVLARLEALERRRSERRPRSRGRLGALVTVAATGLAVAIGMGSDRGPAPEERTAAPTAASVPAPPTAVTRRPEVARPSTAGPAVAAAPAPAPAEVLAEVLAEAPAVPPAVPPAVAPRDAASRFFDPPPRAAAPAPRPALDREAALTRLAGLRRERDRLAGNVAELRQALPPEEPPVVVLGGDDRFELVFDLGRVTAAPPSGGARPAVHRPDDGVPRRL